MFLNHFTIYLNTDLLLRGDNMLLKYKTIICPAQDEIIEKKSRFISNVKPVSSEDEARQFIDDIKKRYWDATHNVFAYQIGENNDIQRFSDDGEPQGTAGLPVLDVLRGEDIKNAAIVVTRYFGGILLGTGGLVRAYGRCAKAGIAAAGIAEMTLYNRFLVMVDYSISGRIQNAIIQNGHIIDDTVYTDKVEYIVLVESEKAASFTPFITDISSATAVITEKEKFYCASIGGKLVKGL